MNIFVNQENISGRTNVEDVLFVNNDNVIEPSVEHIK